MTRKTAQACNRIKIPPLSRLPPATRKTDLQTTLLTAFIKETIEIIANLITIPTKDLRDRVRIDPQRLELLEIMLANNGFLLPTRRFQKPKHTLLPENHQDMTIISMVTLSGNQETMITIWKLLQETLWYNPSNGERKHLLRTIQSLKPPSPPESGAHLLRDSSRHSNPHNFASHPNYRSRNGRTL